MNESIKRLIEQRRNRPQLLGRHLIVSNKTGCKYCTFKNGNKCEILNSYNELWITCPFKKTIEQAKQELHLCYERLKIYHVFDSYNDYIKFLASELNDRTYYDKFKED